MLRDCFRSAQHIKKNLSRYWKQSTLAILKEHSNAILARQAQKCSSTIRYQLLTSPFQYKITIFCKVLHSHQPFMHPTIFIQAIHQISGVQLPKLIYTRNRLPKRKVLQYRKFTYYTVNRLSILLPSSQPSVSLSTFTSLLVWCGDSKNAVKQNNSFNKGVSMRNKGVRMSQNEKQCDGSKKEKQCLFFTEAF